MKKLVALLLSPVLLFIAYLGYCYVVLSEMSIEQVFYTSIRVENNKYPLIAKSVSRQFLKWKNFDSNSPWQGSNTPYLNYIMFFYSKIDKVPIGSGLTRALLSKARKNELLAKQNRNILLVAELLIAKGTDVNSIDPKTGHTILHEAILFKQSLLVQFLVKQNVDPTIKIEKPGTKYHGMDSITYAKLKVKENKEAFKNLPSDKQNKFKKQFDKNMRDRVSIVSLLEKHKSSYLDKFQSNAKK